MVNYYELLGIDKDSTSDEIKNAYKKMAKKYHPDVSKDKDADKIIRSLNEAKETLLNETKRKEYDNLLNSINESKQFTKKKNERYETKEKEYRKTYSDTYITRWQYYKNYFKYAKDNFFLKIFKSLIVGINHTIFTFFKLVMYAFVYILFVVQELIDFLVGLSILLAIIALFVLSGKETPNLIPYVPANIEGFIIFSFIAIFIEFIKILIFTKYGSFFGLINKIENKILVKVLNG